MKDDFEQQAKKAGKTRRLMRDVATTEVEAMRTEYLQGLTLRSLAVSHQVSLESLTVFGRANGWSLARSKHMRNEHRRMSEMKGATNVGRSLAEEAKKEDQAFNEDPVKATQERNKKISRMLDRAIDQMALAMGITDKDYELMADNPQAVVQMSKELVTDKDKNANFVRLFDKFKEATVLQRLVNGQSTSAANREDPSDEEEMIQGVLIRAATIEGLDEVEDGSKDVQDTELDFL